MKVWIVYDENKPLAAFSSDSWAYAWKSWEEQARSYICDHCGSEVGVGLYVATFEIDEQMRVGKVDDDRSQTKLTSPPA